MYDVIIIGAGVTGVLLPGNYRVMMQMFAYWKNVKMYVREHPRQIQQSFMPDLMRKKVP